MEPVDQIERARAEFRRLNETVRESMRDVRRWKELGRFIAMADRVLACNCGMPNKGHHLPECPAFNGHN